MKEVRKAALRFEKRKVRQLYPYANLATTPFPLILKYCVAH
jgi:hypothetical protein